jgi:ATP-binding cassette subfamily B protein
MYRRTAEAVRLGLRAGPALLAGRVGLTVLAGVLPVAASWLTKLLFDELGAGQAGDTGRAATYAVGAAALGVGAVLATHGGSYLAMAHQRAVGLAVEDDLYASVNGFVGLGRFEDPAFLGRLRLAEEAASGAPQSIIAFVLDAVQTVVVVAGFVTALVSIWPPMTGLIALAAVPVLLVQLTLARHRAAVQEATNETFRRRMFYQSLLTDVRAVKEVRLFDLGGLFRRRMLDTATVATGRQLAVERRAILMNSSLALLAAMVTGAGTIAVVVGTGAGRLSIGDVMLFLAAVTAVQGSLAGLAGQVGETASALRLFGHYLDVRAMPPDQPGTGLPVAPLRHGIELRDVWFRYTPESPWVLRGVNLFLPAGSAIGIVGVNGAGKSTLVKLLCRFYRPDRGTITWDGVEIGELDVAQLRRRIGATFQDFMTYDLSARENIGVGDTARMTDLPAIRRAAERAEVDAMLSALPRRYATLLSRVYFDDEPGDQPAVTLSGGQWQRVAIARALLHDDADLLILDEPSSGLDAEAEHRIHEALSAYREGRTSLLISHRMSAIRSADVIAVLAGGVVAELGDHERLMAADSHYARLFGLQARGYQDGRVAT